jgi:hypothetical protein
MTLTDGELVPWPDTTTGEEGGSGLVVLPTATLKAAAFRSDGIDAAHLESLVATEGAWPPILVSAQTHIVIDGAHRLRAGVVLGLESLVCELSYDDESTWYLEFVRRNSTHGKPLGQEDRTRAACELVRRCPDWSNRRIAQCCGMSPHTVAALRKRELDLGAEGARPDPMRRVGRDGRRRPVNGEEARDRIVAEIRKRPRGSLREVAGVVGASPETVRSVRRIMAESPRGLTGSETDSASTWELDRALVAMPSGNEFLTWFQRTAPGERWQVLALLVPLNRVYAVADEARRRSQSWKDFADVLEGRAARRTGT